MGNYGIVAWWLGINSYSTADFEIENDYDKTEANSVRKLYNTIMDDAISGKGAKVTPSISLQSALKSLKNQGTFRDISTSQVASEIENQVQEAFKDRVREEVDEQLEIYAQAPTRDRNKVRSDILTEFESVKISDIPKRVEKTLFETIQSELEDPIIRQASISVTGSPMTKQELFELWHNDRSTWSKIKVAERQILLS